MRPRFIPNNQEYGSIRMNGPSPAHLQQISRMPGKLPLENDFFFDLLFAVITNFHN